MIEDRPTPKNSSVLWDENNQKLIVLLANHLDFGATTIAKISCDRWKWLYDPFAVPPLEVVQQFVLTFQTADQASRRNRKTQEQPLTESENPYNTEL